LSNAFLVAEKFGISEEVLQLAASIKMAVNGKLAVSWSDWRD